MFIFNLGGNQRELARAKNQKKQQELSKKKGADAKDGNKGQSLEERRRRYANQPFGSLGVNSISLLPHFRDAEVMRAKQQKAEQGGQGGSKWVENVHKFPTFWIVFS